MRQVGKQARKVLDILTQDMTRVGDHRKIDNAPGAFMAVVVELVDSTTDGYLYFSVAHYGKLNGDLMRDPEMVFIKAPATGDYLPSYFRNDYIGCERWGIMADGQKDGRTLFKFDVREQTDEARFANMWMKNIWQQQGLRRGLGRIVKGQGGEEEEAA